MGYVSYPSRSVEEEVYQYFSRVFTTQVSFYLLLILRLFLHPTQTTLYLFKVIAAVDVNPKVAILESADLPADQENATFLCSTTGVLDKSAACVT